MTVTDEQTNRPKKLVGAFVALILTIALAAQLVRPDTDDQATNEPETTALPTPTTAVEEPPATQTPVEVAITPTATPTAAPTPRPTSAPAANVPQPTAPHSFDLGQALLVGDTLVVPAGGGVWIYDDQFLEWHLASMPAGTTGVSCPTVLDSTLTFVTTYQAGAFGFATVDLETQNVSVTPLPVTNYDVAAEAHYCGAVSFDGVWATAATDGKSMTFAISEDQGASLSERRLDLPESWLPDSPFSLVGTRTKLQNHRNQIMVTFCLAWGFESTCGETSFLLDGSSLTSLATDSAWTGDFAPTVVQPSDAFVGYQSPDRPGMYTDPGQRTFFPLDGELWRAELIEITDVQERAHVNLNVGRWAAGPLDGDMVALPVGYRPRLFPYQGGLAAQVPLEVPQFGEWDKVIETEWWSLPPDATKWTRLPTPLALEERTIARGVPSSLHSVTMSPDNEGLIDMLLVPTIRAEDPWIEAENRGAGNDPEYRGNLHIIGDRLYGVDYNGIWLSVDRGASFERIPNQAPISPCSNASEFELAHMTRHVEQVDQMLIVEQSLNLLTNSTDYRSIELPIVELENLANTVLYPCRAINLDERWLLGQMDLASAELTISATNASGSLDTYRIDLSGQWHDDIGRPVYQGEVDLFLDGEWIVARMCSPHGGAQCGFTDVTFHSSLVTGSASTGVVIDAEEQLALGQIRLVNAGERAADSLFQVGAQLWRANTDETTGESVRAGEGGSSVPVYTWVGGPFTGPLTPLPHQTMAPREAQPWSLNHEGLYFRFNGQVMTCDGPATADAECWILLDGGWQRHLGPVSVDWATVPAGVPVTFSHRSESGRIMVIPTG